MNIPAFELIIANSEPDYLIPVFPDTKALQDIAKRNKSTAEKLYNGLSWEITATEARKGVLRFRARSDESVRENWILNQNELSRTEAVYEYILIVEKIQKDTGLSYQEVENMARQPMNHVEVLKPYMKELTSCLIKLNATSSDKIANARNKAIATLVMQENLMDKNGNHIPWNEEDTDNLSQSLFIELVKYYNSYQTEETDIAENITEGELNIESGQSNSNGKIAQTGIRSTTISSIGESTMNDSMAKTLDVAVVV
jgi:hypothetical protein